MKKQIISASRRTDIPAWYGQWFLDKIKQKSADIPNPYNPKQISHLSLAPQDVEGIVFWSKNPAPFLEELDKLEEYQFYFQYTITGYGHRIEPRLPPLVQRIKTLEELNRKIGGNKIVWRFDPILLSPDTGFTETLNRFRSLCIDLDGLTSCCISSFFQTYKKNAKKTSQYAKTIPDGDKLSLGLELADIAKHYKIDLSWCCQQWIKAPLKQARCIDAARFDPDANHQKDKGQREHCACAKSRDIGQYGSCKTGCVYCYAI